MEKWLWVSWAAATVVDHQTIYKKTENLCLVWGVSSSSFVSNWALKWYKFEKDFFTVNDDDDILKVRLASAWCIEIQFEESVRFDKSSLGRSDSWRCCEDLTLC